MVSIGSSVGGVVGAGVIGAAVSTGGIVVNSVGSSVGKYDTGALVTGG